MQYIRIHKVVNEEINKKKNLKNKKFVCPYDLQEFCHLPFDVLCLVAVDWMTYYILMLLTDLEMLGLRGNYW